MEDELTRMAREMIAASMTKKAEVETPKPIEEEEVAPEKPKEIVLTEEQDKNLAVSQRMFQESDQKMRYKGADWFGKITKETATVVGAGGIGSYVIFNLARAAIGMLYVYDGDTVDAVNMAGQLYRVEDIGKFKVDALKDIVMQYTPTLQGCFFSEMFQGDEPLSPITVTALDSMSARKLVFESWLRYIDGMSDEQKNKTLFVDGRMSASSYQVFVFRASQPEKIEMYRKKCLFSDAQADATSCSFKATSHIGGGIGSYIMSIIQEHLHLEDLGFFEKSIKFFNEFSTDFGVTLTQRTQWQFRKV